MIRETETVVFVVSPKSTVSPVCKWEVDQSVQNGKRIVAVLCRPLDCEASPKQLEDQLYLLPPRA